MGCCQNSGPLLSLFNTRCRIILRTQRGTIILTTTHILVSAILCSWGNEVSAFTAVADEIYRGSYKEHRARDDVGKCVGQLTSLYRSLKHDCLRIALL